MSEAMKRLEDLTREFIDAVNAAPCSKFSGNRTMNVAAELNNKLGKSLLVFYSFHACEDLLDRCMQFLSECTRSVLKAGQKSTLAKVFSIFKRSNVLYNEIISSSRRTQDNHEKYACYEKTYQIIIDILEIDPHRS